MTRLGFNCHFWQDQPSFFHWGERVRPKIATYWYYQIHFMS